MAEIVPQLGFTSAVGPSENRSLSIIESNPVFSTPLGNYNTFQSGKLDILGIIDGWNKANNPEIIKQETNQLALMVGLVAIVATVLYLSN